MRKLWSNLWGNLLGGVISVADKVCVLCYWVDNNDIQMVDHEGNEFVFRD